MVEGVVGIPLLLELSLTNGDTSRFPRAEIYTELGVLLTTLDLVHVANGLYRVLWTSSIPAQYAVHYTVFTDAGHTLGASAFDRVVDHIIIRSQSQDDSFRAILGHLGQNVRDDVLTYDANSRPIALRRRIFASAADALASTPGGVGEGEILTITGSALHFDAARWETLLRTVV